MDKSVLQDSKCWRLKASWKLLHYQSRIPLLRYPDPWYSVLICCLDPDLICDLIITSELGSTQFRRQSKTSSKVEARGYQREREREGQLAAMMMMMNTTMSIMMMMNTTSARSSRSSSRFARFQEHLDGHRDVARRWITRDTMFVQYSTALTVLYCTVIICCYRT